jgi:hypothetical protein
MILNQIYPCLITVIFAFGLDDPPSCDPIDLGAILFVLPGNPTIGRNPAAIIEVGSVATTIFGGAPGRIGGKICASGGGA